MFSIFLYSHAIKEEKKKTRVSHVVFKTNQFSNFDTFVGYFLAHPKLGTADLV